MYIHGMLCFRLSFGILDSLEVSGQGLGMRDFFVLDRYTPPSENLISGDSYAKQIELIWGYIILNFLS